MDRVGGRKTEHRMGRGFRTEPRQRANESAGLEELPTPVDLDLTQSATAPVDPDVEDLFIAPADLFEGRPQIEINTGNSTNCQGGPRAIAERRGRGRGRHWSLPGWPMSRLQIVLLVLLVADCILVGWWAEIVRALPQASSFYKLVGLSVNLRDLAFDGVITAAEQHGSAPVLVVEGNIINVARMMADIPRPKFIVRNAAQQEIASWTGVASRTMLPPGEAVSFRTKLASPPPDAHDIFVRFVDNRDIVTAER